MPDVRRPSFATAGISILAILTLAVIACAFSSSASAATLSNATFNLQGHQGYTNTQALPWTTMSCYSSLTSNSGSVQSHRAGVMSYDAGSGGTYWSAWTTATTAYSPTTTCYNSPWWGYAEQSTSASVVRNYTLRVYGN
jgi:hypothetical protein